MVVELREAGMWDSGIGYDGEGSRQTTYSLARVSIASNHLSYRDKRESKQREEDQTKHATHLQQAVLRAHVNTRT